MRLINIVFLSFIVNLICNGQNSINYSNFQSIDDINKEVINDFFNNVIDTIIGNCYLFDIPINKTDLIDKRIKTNGVSLEEKEFFKQQIEKFKFLKWEHIIESKKLFYESESDSLFKQGPRKGWEEFNVKYGKECICVVTIPLFTIDFKNIYIEFGKQCSEVWGYGVIYVFELIDNKWHLVKRYETWIS